MSRLLLLAGSPPLQALEARAYSAYDGCVSLDTSTASTIYNLDQSDPPTCASTCGDEYQYVAIQAQFCFCFPSPPSIFTTHNDSDCSINCDYPYQDDSCGGVTPGTLIDVYSFYAGSDLAQPGDPSGDDGNASSGISSLILSQPTSSPSEQAGTSMKPTTTDEPSPGTPRPTASATNGALPLTGTAETDGAASSQENAGIPGMGMSTATTSGPKVIVTDGTATVVPGEPTPVSPGDPGSLYTNFPGPTTAAASQPVSTYTITLWTTVTSYTTVYPGGPLYSTVVSMPLTTTCVTAKFFTSSCSEVTVTSTCAEDGSVVTSVLPGSVHVVPYNPYVSEVMELVVEGAGVAASTRTVLAAVVEGRSVLAAPGEGTPAGTQTVTAEAGDAPLITASPLVGSTGWVVTASGSQMLNASATLSQLPVTAGSARAGLGWQDSMMIGLLFAVVLGAIC